jgi:hypothetical protein
MALLHQRPLQRIFVPLILFCDKSHTDLNGKLTLEPLNVTLGIFKRETRRLVEAWRTVALIPNLSLVLPKGISADDKSEDLHYILDQILGP